MLGLQQGPDPLDRTVSRIVRAPALEALCQGPEGGRRAELVGVEVDPPLLQGPDLDRPRGWLQLSLRSPAFVLSTALRDLGVPPTALPCGQAIADLAPSGQIAAVELDDGTEIWCVAGDVRDDPGREGQDRRLCDVVARDTVGAQAARFTEEGLRELSFDPRSAR